MGDQFALNTNCALKTEIYGSQPVTLVRVIVPECRDNKKKSYGDKKHVHSENNLVPNHVSVKILYGFKRSEYF